MSDIEESGSGNLGIDGDNPPFLLYHYYGIGAGGLIILFTVFILCVLITRCSKYYGHFKKKYECDYDDVITADRAIIELFGEIDKRESSPVRKPSEAETNFPSATNPQHDDDSVDDDNFEELPKNLVFENSKTVVVVDLGNDPHDSKTKRNSFIIVPTAASTEIVYDKLDQAMPAITPGDNTYDDLLSLSAAQTQSQQSKSLDHHLYLNKLSVSSITSTNPVALKPPQTLQVESTNHIYDDAFSPKRSKDRSNTLPNHLYPFNDDPFHHQATLPNSVHTEKGFVTDCFRPASHSMSNSSHTHTRPPVHQNASPDYYVLPDIPPTSSSEYSYATNHLLLPPSKSRNGTLGEVRSEKGQRHASSSPSKRASSIYTNIDEIVSSTEDHTYMNIDAAMNETVDSVAAINDPTYSRIDDEEYVYAREKMLMSPTRSNKPGGQGEFVMKPDDHHEYLFISSRMKNKRLPNRYVNHTYMNLETARRQAFDQNLSSKDDSCNNPLYAKTDELLEDMKLLQQKPQLTHCSKSAVMSKDDSHTSDYFSTTTDWLSHTRKRAGSDIRNHFQHLHTRDHIYMSILGRERVYPDYEKPKPSLALLSSEARHMPSRIQRTHSFSNDLSDYRFYENQAMWLPSQGTIHGIMPSSPRNSADYMKLLGSGYESQYTTPKMFRCISQV